MNFSFITQDKSNSYFDKHKISEDTDTFVFEWKTNYDYENKKLYVYPKYKLKNGYLLYTSKEDFENDVRIKQLTPFQRSIAFLARDIFGNFVPIFPYDRQPDYFSSLTMSQTGRIVDTENNRNRILGTTYDITNELEFEKYYDSLKEPVTVVDSKQVLKKELKL